MSANVDEYFDGLAPAVAPVAERLRALVESELPGTASKLYHGIPVWLVGDSPSIGIKAGSKDVALMFFTGQRMSDPTGRLRSSGSFEMASTKFSAIRDVDEPVVRDWLRQAKAVDS